MRCSHCGQPVYPPAIMVSILYPSRASEICTLHRACFYELCGEPVFKSVARMLSRVGWHQYEMPFPELGTGERDI